MARPTLAASFGAITRTLAACMKGACKLKNKTRNCAAMAGRATITQSHAEKREESMSLISKTAVGFTLATIVAAGCAQKKVTTTAPVDTMGTAVVGRPAPAPAGQPEAVAAPSPTTAASAGPATAPAPAPAEVMVNGVPVSGEKYRLVQGQDEIVSVLNDGAVVIAKQVMGSPVLSVRGYVHTGGIYEGKWLGGGLSHLLEHLVAGGSNDRRTEAQSRELLQQIGNNSNAYTSSDHTAYFVNTTPQNLDKAVDLVTGWMLHARITPDEYARERQVVQRELEMGRGESGRQFAYMMEMNRYQVSPARVPVIGYQEVIQGLSRDDVYSYYKQAYEPNNMVFSVAGDLPPEVMLKAVQRYIDVPAGRVFDRTIPDEPEVLTPRTLVTTMPKIGEAMVDVAYPTVRLDSKDLYALDLLAAVLGQGEGSVLVREVRDKGLATAVSAYSSTPAYVDGSFAVMLHVKSEKMDAAIEAVQLVLDQAKREPLDAAAVQRAKTQMRVDHLRELQETQNVAGSMATDYLSTGDVHFIDKYLQRIAAVTPAEMQAVARKYFDNQRLVKTIMLPQEETQGKGLPGAEQILRAAGTQASTQASTQTADQVYRSELDNGTILLVRRVPTSPLIAVRMYATGGLTAETDTDSGIGNLTMRMLMRGTSFRSARQLAEQLDAMGASVETACGNNTWFWNASMLKEDFDKGMEIYADVVNNPAFAKEELETMRKRVLAGIASRDADWGAQAMRYFRKQFFPASSPYHLQTSGETETVSAMQAQQLKSYYTDTVLKSRRVLAIYGDIDPDQAKQVAQKLLGQGMKLNMAVTPVQEVPAIEPADHRPQAAVLRVDVQKTQQPLAGVVIGYEANPVIGEKSYDTFSVADTMTSGWGYPTGYLHETLRGEGLVYVVAASVWPGRSVQMPGTFFVYAGCEPDKVNEVIDKILLNIARLQGTPQDMQVDWFNRSKQLLLTDEAMSKETVAEQATSAALDELWGLGYDYSKGLPQRVNAVTLDQIQAIARQRLRRCVVTVSTPAPELLKVTTGIRVYDSFPTVELTPKGVQHDVSGGGK